MLQHLWPRNIAILIHMADNDDRNIHAFCRAHQQTGAFPDLRYAAGRGGNVGVVHGLYRINDHKIRLFRLDKFGNKLHICFTHDIEIRRCHPQPLGPQLDLVRRLLAGNIEHAQRFP